jgi:small-conductance mechanosensitive channel
MTNDNVASVVPNSKIVNQNFLNWTFRERRTRVSVPIGVASDSDVDLVTRTLLRAAEGVQFLLEEPKPSVQFMEFGDFDLKFRLLVWTDRPRRHIAIRSEINYRIARLFREAGIEIPNPQRDINLRSGALRLDPRGGLPSAGDGEDGRMNDEVEARRP